MVRQATRYGLSVTVPMKVAEASERVQTALAAEGFGVLCEIDVAATMKKKLDVDFKPYVILGACNPSLALQALTAEPDVGLLLPCNVIVYASDTAGQSVVAAIDPIEAPGVSGNEALRPLAAEVRTRLTRVLEAVER